MVGGQVVEDQVPDSLGFGCIDAMTKACSTTSFSFQKRRVGALGGPIEFEHTLPNKEYTCGK
jgi:hypothetical protein